MSSLNLGAPVGGMRVKVRKQRKVEPEERAVSSSRAVRAGWDLSRRGSSQCML